MKTTNKKPNTSRILALPRYGLLGASSRMRQFQFIQYLKDAGFQVTIRELISSDNLNRRYLESGYKKAWIIRSYIRRIRIVHGVPANSILWIEKELMPWMPSMLETLILGRRKYVLDYDDAIFHNYDLHDSKFVNRFYRDKIKILMSRANAVFCGNQYLADYAIKSGCQRVVIIPTVVNLKNYKIISRHPKQESSNLLRIVWIGSQVTDKYLDLVRPALLALSAKTTFLVRIIGSNRKIPGVEVENFQWNEMTENARIAECDIGIMPLADEPWERGKCGYKLIQYMASGLPVVASPVGANNSIIKHGYNGFFATNTDQWVEALKILFDDVAIRRQFGSNSREIVEKRFSTEAAAPNIISEFRRLI